MDIVGEKSSLRGSVVIPGSKSHTIRAVAIGGLAAGQSCVRAPLDSEDTRAAVRAYRALGAEITLEEGLWRIKGCAGAPQTPENVIDAANSGTSLNVALGSCALLRSGTAVLTGDRQVRRRSSRALAGSLNDLGARVRSTRDNGCAPFVVQGVLRGGTTTLEAVSSQYLTSLLLNAPLGGGNTQIAVPLLYERPYVEMTLDWLVRQGIAVKHDQLRSFQIPGGQRYQAFDRRIPADFSSATFFLAAGALDGNDVTCQGLDMNDTQGDRAVVDYLRQMGAKITCGSEGVRVQSAALRGCELDLNATPDALPMMSVLACFAEGATRLCNVPQARIKETDRIAVMKTELERLGARVEELEDGLVIEPGPLKAAGVDGHGDHRVIMALAIAATRLEGRTAIHGGEAVNVTFPNFLELLSGLGGKIRSE